MLSSINELKANRGSVKNIALDKSLVNVNAVLGKSKGVGLRTVVKCIGQVKCLKEHKRNVYRGFYLTSLSAEKWLMLVEGSCYGSRTDFQ